MESFCEGLAKTPFASDTVLLCTSYRNVASMKKGPQETDWYKMEKVIAALIKKGYRCEPFGLASMESRNPWLRIEEIQAEDDTPYPYCFLRDEYGDLPIQDIAPDFVPEDSIVEFLNSPGTIRRTCSYYRAREGKYLRRHPEETNPAPKKVCAECCDIRCNPGARIVFRRARMHGGLGGDMPVCILGIRFFLKKALAWLKIEAEGQMGKEMYR